MKKTSIYSVDTAHVAKNGLRIAPENYRVDKDVTIGNGTVIKKGKEFFTLSELFTLRSAGALPEGWDIPTKQELHDIADEFGILDGCRHTHHLMTSLGISLMGTPLGGESYVRYNKNPRAGGCFIIGRNAIGYYLGTNESRANSAAMLFINDCHDGFYVAECDPNAIGSVRLVYRGLKTT